MSVTGKSRQSGAEVPEMQAAEHRSKREKLSLASQRPRGLLVRRTEVAAKF
jgi:hypothetical protein